MRILDRYILKPVLGTFAGCLFIFIFLYVISDVLGRLDEILKSHISLGFICRYYLTYFPIIFTQTSPIALLLSAVYTFSKLNRNSELIALRASGLSLWQISSSIVTLGLVLSLGVFYVSEKFVPMAAAEAETMKTRIEGNTSGSSKKEEIISHLAFYGLENRLFFVNSFDTKNNIMKGITILEHDRAQNLTAKIVANEGAYKNKLWIFYEYTKFHFDPDGQITEDTAYSPQQIMDITETPEDFLQQRRRPELMTITQLEDYIWRLEKSSAIPAARSLLVDLYQRYAASATSLILVLIGIPFSFVIRKRANLFSSFGICICVSFLYYISTAIAIALGKAEILFPFLSAWIVPAGFSFFAVKAIQRTS